MILRPLITEEPPHSGPQPIWSVIDRTQQPRMSECWLIPQPAHAALSGEIASHLDERHFPGIDGSVVQAIALHDAGWGMPDAAAIQSSRVATAKNPFFPRSFTKFPPADTMNIWTFSIDTAQNLGPLGGYIVSRHFAQISGHQAAQHDSKNLPLFARFEEQERRRQDRLLAKTGRTVAELDPLVTALQFCDLLSLYIACGALDDVILPQKIDGREITLRRTGPSQCAITPFPFREPVMLSIAGIRHPKPSKPQASAQTFSLRVG